MIRAAPALLLDVEALAQVAIWQREAGSREVCAFCVADGFGKLHLLPVTNQADLPDKFEVSRFDEAFVKAAATQRGWEIVAFMHTHPYHAPEMSERDALAFECDNLPWIIVGNPTTSPQQRCYSAKRCAMVNPRLD